MFHITINIDWNWDSYSQAFSKFSPHMVSEQVWENSVLLCYPSSGAFLLFPAVLHQQCIPSWESQFQCASENSSRLLPGILHLENLSHAAPSFCVWASRSPSPCIVASFTRPPPNLPVCIFSLFPACFSHYFVIIDTLKSQTRSALLLWHQQRLLLTWQRILPLSPPVFTGTPAITSKKLLGAANYLSWATAVELWFIGQGHEGHLTKQAEDITDAKRPKWKKIDAQLCGALWQSIDCSFVVQTGHIKPPMMFGRKPKNYLPMKLLCKPI